MAFSSPDLRLAFLDRRAGTLHASLRAAHKDNLVHSIQAWRARLLPAGFVTLPLLSHLMRQRMLSESVSSIVSHALKDVRGYLQQTVQPGSSHCVFVCVADLLAQVPVILLLRMLTLQASCPWSSHRRAPASKWQFSIMPFFSHACFRLLIPRHQVHSSGELQRVLRKETEAERKIIRKPSETHVEAAEHGKVRQQRFCHAALWPGPA